MKRDMSIDFIELLPKLDIQSFMGVSVILGIMPLDHENNIKPFENLIEEMVDKFGKKNRRFRKETIKLMQKAIKENQNEAKN